jgi:hypothetical protein
MTTFILKSDLKWFVIASCKIPPSSAPTVLELRIYLTFYAKCSNIYEDSQIKVSQLSYLNVGFC